MEVVFLFILVAMMMFTLGIGFPVAFALPGSAIVTIGLAAGTGWLFTGDASSFFMHGTAVEWLSAGVTNFRGIYWEAERDTLIAIPLFVFMGIMLQRSRIAEELLVTMAKLFGGLPGGLGISVVVVGALLAATTGIVGATVVAMGLISLPAMMRNNYSQPLATGSVLASGTLGQIIPPSIVLIILADQLSSAVDQAAQLRSAEYREATGAFSMPSELGVTSTSAGDMFMGALFPGLLLVGMYIVFILIFALISPKSAPSVPIEGRMDRRFWFDVFFATVPPLLLIVLVLGSIITGVATVTQAGAVGAAGATVMAGYKIHEGRGRFVPAIIVLAMLVVIYLLSVSFNLNIRQMDRSGAALGVALAALAVIVLLAALGWSAWRTLKIDNTLRAVMIETAKTSSLVFIILLGAAMLISAFRAFGGEHMVRDFLGSMPGGFWGQFIIVMIVIFLLGFFLDFIEIAIVVVPIVAPILLMNPEANITAVWLGVMIGLNIQTSFLTPPFGFALFYLRGVADRTVKTLNMYKGVIPFIALQLGALVVVGYNPPLVNYLPARVQLLSENAPPPRNPRLQHCVEELLIRDLPAQESTVRGLLATLEGADRSILPPAQERELDTAIAAYEASFAQLDAFVAAMDAIEDATPSYQPLHREVADIRREMLGHTQRIDRLQAQMRNFRGDAPVAVAGRERIEAQIAAAEADRAAAEAQIPERWEQAQRDFQALVQVEMTARNDLRRPTEQAYLTFREMAQTIAAAEAFADLRPRVEALAAEVNISDNSELASRVQALEGEIAALPGSADLRSALSDIRDGLTGRRASAEAAADAAEAAVEQVHADTEWRRAASATLLTPLRAIEEETRFTLGMREQPRLEREHALEVARCVSVHRDVSLRF
ncbi:TRAP transporter large permease subunit [Rhodobacteraceae bacterium 2376]|uniref:TRAP transporter large permease subunit n=1 Tax=Rhabdonatronobacter sediminivivens TaxID=2743469 RepID=A0A7Z0HZ04_9RHOB|nr:TRAP transporter large permease subunit [Rhabdonatronobacter sediminivivens]NYS24901.1 TRAP transporter large permease subunit [Rhabdonatronobacter sediminivivens]